MDEQLSQLGLDDKFEKIFFELYNGTARGINYEVVYTKPEFKRIIPLTSGSASPVASFSIFNLDLDADKYYRFFLEIEADAATNCIIRVNADNTAGNYTGVQTITGAASASAVVTGIDLNGGGGRKIAVEFDIARRTSTKSDTYIIWKASTYSAATGDNITTGSARYTPATNMTNLLIADTSGGGANWNYSYTIYKRSF